MLARAQVSSRRRAQQTGSSALYQFNWSGEASLGQTVTRSGTATRINSSGVRVSAAVNTVRHGYSGEDPNTYLGIMLEPGATNLAFQSGNPLSAPWAASNLTVAASAGTGMAGTNSLYSLTQTANGSNLTQTVTVPDGANLTTTWYLKAGTGRWVFLGMQQATTWNGNQYQCWVDLQTGLIGAVDTNGVGTSFSAVSHEARILANGIVEVKVRAKLAAGFNAVWLMLSPATANNTWDGLSGNSYLFDSVQIEATTYGTSYIPTTTGAVARGAETVTVPMANGSYDILVADSLGGEWRNAVTVSGGAYSVTPRTGMYSVVRIAAYAAGALTADQKAALNIPEPYAYLSGLPLTFSEDFTDTNVSRISDSGTVASAGGGPSWRSRYKHGGTSVTAYTLSNESQLYTNGGTGGYLGINPFSIANSVLTISAGLIPNGTANVPTNTAYEPDAPYKFYSGLISSEPYRRFTYGVFEARIRSDAINGTWPAFWLIRDVDEPLGGEIDILENIGNTPTVTHQTYHEHDENNHFASGSPITFPGGGLMSDWHIYAVKWERGKIRWYLDGKLTKVIDRTGLDHHPMILIANLALNTIVWMRGAGAQFDSELASGFWDPNLSGGPTKMEIDWIRVYQDSTTVEFQNGVGGYSGNVDTMLNQSAPTANNSTATLLRAGMDDPTSSGQQSQILMRFDNIIGAGVGQVPVNADIYSAIVEFEVSNTTLNPVGFHRMLQSWAVTDTWNSRTAGVSTNGTEAVLTTDLDVPHVKWPGYRSFDVTASVQSWASGQTNNGWVILGRGADTLEIYSADSTIKPKLTVTYKT